MFRVGQRVECVDASLPLLAKILRVIFRIEWPLVRGNIYTVQRLAVIGGDECVELYEVKNIELLERCFLRKRFRPIVDRPTDISVFEEMLHPSKIAEACDYFAAAALPAVIASTSAGQHMLNIREGETVMSAIARDAFVLAEKSNATGPKAKVICSGLGGNRANARLIAAAPAMLDYIARKAAEGDEDARALLAEYSITKRTTEG